MKITFLTNMIVIFMKLMFKSKKDSLSEKILILSEKRSSIIIASTCSNYTPLKLLKKQTSPSKDQRK